MADAQANQAIADQLRNAVRDIRRKSYPIADLIPLLTRAADALSERGTPGERLPSGYEEISAAIVKIADETNSLAELCLLYDEDANFQKVPEYWVPRMEVLKLVTQILAPSKTPSKT